MDTLWWVIGIIFAVWTVRRWTKEAYLAGKEDALDKAEAEKKWNDREERKKDIEAFFG